jgi:hypothetical protein
MPHNAANGSKSRFLYRPLVVAGDRPVADRWYVPRHLRGAVMSSVVSGAVPLKKENDRDDHSPGLSHSK